MKVERCQVNIQKLFGVSILTLVLSFLAAGCASTETAKEAEVIATTVPIDSPPSEGPIVNGCARLISKVTNDWNSRANLRELTDADKKNIKKAKEICCDNATRRELVAASAPGMREKVRLVCDELGANLSLAIEAYENSNYAAVISLLANYPDQLTAFISYLMGFSSKEVESRQGQQAH